MEEDEKIDPKEVGVLAIKRATISSSKKVLKDSYLIKKRHTCGAAELLNN
jgi:hypothetical protein